MLDTLNDFLRVFIRFESFLFRLSYLSLTALALLVVDIHQADSIELFWEIKRAESEAPFFGLITLPFWLDVLAWSITIPSFLVLIAYFCDMRGKGIFKYTPMRFVIVFLLYLIFFTFIFSFRTASNPIIIEYVGLWVIVNLLTFLTFNPSYSYSS